jgi:glycosyltransferase involved in cell wall biosynthesis
MEPVAPRRILFVSGFFPPYSPLGAVRPPALAAYWRAQGHDVRVIALKNPAVIGKIPLPLPEDRVTYVPFEMPGGGVQRIANGVVGTLRRLRPDAAPPAVADRALPSAAAAAVAADERGALHHLRRLYQYSVQFPDRYRSWMRPGVAAGLALARDWEPELIYSSGPPHSAHIVASRIARRLALPWVVELRDVWANNPYVQNPAPIELAQRVLSRGVLRQATACVTLTATASAEVHAITRRPTVVSFNGFEREDFLGLEEVPPLDAKRLTIVHAGVIYAGRRDPVALFQALAILGPQRHAVRVLFYHDEMASVLRRAEQAGVADCIEICRPVPRAEILRIERAADVLLLCRWADPKDDGIIPGKVFEYIGARRPILAVGSTTGEAAEIIRGGDFGLVSNSPMEIAEQLRSWIVEKHAAGGRLPDLPQESTEAFLRETQFRKIDPLLERLTSRPLPLPTA